MSAWSVGGPSTQGRYANRAVFVPFRPRRAPVSRTIASVLLTTDGLRAHLLAARLAGVVGTTRDPATPYKWAKSLASQLSSGTLLTYEGDGHTARELRANLPTTILYGLVTLGAVLRVIAPLELLDYTTAMRCSGLA